MPKEQEKTIRNKQRLIRLFKYLYRETDEDHPVTTNELVEIFTDANANAARKTVKDDIDVLVEEGYDIVEVNTSPSMIVHWALQYGEYVEIMNEDIRVKIREELDKLTKRYQ